MPKKIKTGFPVQLDVFEDVETWGAVGDGSTDDTSSFQTAINKLPAAGGVILVPEGNFIVTGGSLSVGSKTVFWLLNGQVNTSYTAAGSGLPGTVLNDIGGSALTDLSDWPSITGNTLKFLRVNAGETAVEWASGAAGISNVVEDLTPELGGQLVTGANAIVAGTVNVNIELQTTGTGDIVLNSGRNVTVPNQIKHDTANSGIDFAPGGAEELDFITNSVIRMNLNDSGLLLGEANARVTTILDEDAMGSNSATALATQQSIKAYVDAQAATGVTTEADETVVGTPVAAIDVTGLGSYKRLEIQFVDVSGDATASIQLRTSTDNGSTFATTGYESMALSPGGSDSSTGAMLVTRSNAASVAWSGTVIVNFWDDDVATYTGSGADSGGGTGLNSCGGRGPTGGGFDAIRIMMSSGNIDGGTVRVRGVT